MVRRCRAPFIRSKATATRNTIGRLHPDDCREAGCACCGTSTVPCGGWRSTVWSRAGPEARRLVPRFWITNAPRIGRSPIVAWKLVPKSTAKALADVLPRLSEIIFAVNPAENRSEKFCEYVPATKVSETE